MGESVIRSGKEGHSGGGSVPQLYIQKNSLYELSDHKKQTVENISEVTPMRYNSDWYY